MTRSTQRPDSPYRVVADQIHARIESGELRPGDRVPSIREIAARWGIAIATATRVTATLRDEGLVEAKVGSGTVVSARGSGQGRQSPVLRAVSGPANSSPVWPSDLSDQASNRQQLLGAAIEIADTEGLDAVSMRRLGAYLGVGPMSLYRYVATKDELLMQMADTVFAEVDLPEPGPDGWRAKLELIAREQWQLCRRHLWLPRVVSFTRPLLAPNMMAQTEWTLRALDGLGLPMPVRFRETLTLHALVATGAMAMTDEAEAETSTGMTLERWTEAQQGRARELLYSGRFPLMASMAEAGPPDLDNLFEYRLARHLDGFSALLADRTGKGARTLTMVRRPAEDEPSR